MPRMLALSAVLLVLGCQSGDGMMPGDGMVPDETMMPGDGMGMGLGEDADVTVLADGMAEQLSAGPLAWVVHEPAADDEIAHAHAAGFVYANDGAHVVMVEGEEVALEEGESVFLEDGVEHTHGGGAFWDIQLATLQAEGPPSMEGLSVVFQSEPLGGIPEPPVLLSFVLVALPAGGGNTAVHAHPGPEYIYVSSGSFEYETGLSETEQLGEGDHRALPADTAVQKRNPGMEQARFLSWFVLDPERPFSSEASFQ